MEVVGWEGNQLHRQDPIYGKRKMKQKKKIMCQQQGALEQI